MRRHLSTLLELIFPSRCLGCGRWGAYFCPACLADLKPAPPEDRPNPETLAVLAYGDPRVKRAIWLIKYRGARSLGKTLAALLYERLLEYLAERALIWPGEDRRWLVVPLPLSPRRRRERGFNQAAIIAGELSKLNPGIFSLETDAMIKIKETPSQVTIADRERRLHNLRGAFTVSRPGALAGRKIILVDDVITTGGTVSEARRVLLAAGAQKVISVAVAQG